MARRHFSVPRGRSSPRTTEWASIAGFGTTLTAAGGSLLASLNAAALALRPFTIVRTHLSMTVRSDQIVASEDYGGALGMAVVSDQATAIGISAIPTPVTDADSDLFFVHQYMVGSVGFADSTGIWQRANTQVEVDSKAMRKVNADQDVVLVVELDVGIGNGMGIFGGGRFLIKLH